MNIIDICKEYTNLSFSDIDELRKISDMLPTISELVRADVFLDCITKDHTKAIVVAEAKPIHVKSNYMNSVVGKIALQENEPAALRTLNTGVSTRGLKAITQEDKTVIQTTVPVRNKKGEVIAVLIIEQATNQVFKDGENINSSTLSKSLEDFPEMFQYMGQNLNLITQNIDDSIIVFDRYGVAIYANPCAKRLYKKLGYRDNIVGMKFNNLVLDEISFEKVLMNNYSKTPEISAGNLDLEIKYSIMRQKGKVTGVNMIIKDITEVKEKEKELILKSVVIKEIHHRVKNNLQTIVSLLRLQSRRVDDDYLKKAFNESISRILSISVTHELLAQEGIDEVDIKSILKMISKNTLDYISTSDQNIEVNVLGDNFSVDSDKATSIALVVNELIQNSIEHGFKDRDHGYIEIVIYKGEIHSTISVKDDGRGFNVKDIKMNSLGLNIVEQIVKDKLEGDFIIDSGKEGTKIIFDFKN